MQIVVLLLLIL